MLEAVAAMATLFNPGPSPLTNAALVHFSSPDQRTGILFNLQQALNAYQINASIQGLSWTSIEGVDDLSL